MFKSPFHRCAALLATLVVALTFSAANLAATTYAPAYPRSCFADGLPLGKSSADAQAVTSPLVYYSYVTALGSYVSETGGAVTVWRVPCPDGSVAAVIELDRSSTFNGSTTQYPIFPAISITTPSNTTTSVFPRFARDIGTRFEDTPQGTPFYSNTVFTFEYYDPNDSRASASIDYKQAFTMSINNLAGGSPLLLNVPAYTGTAPAAVPISGYLATNWYNPAHSGEGMIVQVYDGTGTTRVFTAAWYTYDPLGVPFWLFAQGSINVGDTAANNIATYYFTGGGFAGDFGTSSTAVQWGTMSFTFPDCNTMTFSYDGHTDAQTNGPSGTGTQTWTRAANVNNLECH